MTAGLSLPVPGFHGLPGAQLPPWKLTPLISLPNRIFKEDTLAHCKWEAAGRSWICGLGKRLMEKK